MFRYVFFVILFSILSAKCEILKDDSLYFPELNYLNKKVDPCNNFYEFSCGNFAKYNPLPKDQVMWDNFKILQEEIDSMSMAVLSSKIRQGDAEAVKKAKDMYAACVNTNYADFEELAPIVGIINDLGGWPMISTQNRQSHFSWEFIGDLISKYGLSLFIDWEIRPYIKNATINMIMLKRDPLTLPATAVTHIEDMPIDFLPDSPLNSLSRGQSPYVKYVNHIALQIRNYIGSWRDTAFIYEDVTDVLNFMIQIKQSLNYPLNASYTSEEIDTIGDLQKWSDSFSSNYKRRINWVSFFNHAFAKSGAQVNEETKVYTVNPEAVANVLALVETTDIETVMNFIITRLLTYMAPDSSTQMWKEFNNMYKDLNYTVYSREKYCMRKIVSYPNVGMSMAVAHEYQNYYFDLNKITSAKEMIDDLMAAFLDLLDKNNWMDEPAKELARDKAKHMLKLIGFPDFVYNSKELDKYYAKLRVCRYDHFGNSQKIRAFNMAKNVEEIDKPRDRTLWSQSPLYVNAYYNMLNNRISFPAGIMNSPFYGGKFRFVDYSRIGALIGHEITHGFDSNGKNTDAIGTMVINRWSKNVTLAFQEKANCFIDQYWQYEIDEIGLNVNGNISLPENIADNGGIREAYLAYQKLNNKYTDILHDKEFTLDQLFFISYATMWCKTDTIYSLQKMYKDVHAPNRFRVIGTLSNMKEFSNAFNCPVGSKMNPKNKCILW